MAVKDQKDIIYLKTLAGFSMRYDGNEIAAGKQSESQIGLLMLLLMHNRQTGVSRSLIKKTLFEDRDIEDVAHAIRNVLYNARKTLKSHGLPDVSFVRQKKGIYYWTDEVSIVEDAHEFETAYREAMDEPDEKSRADRLIDAVYLYSGRFLPEVESVVWVFQEADRYREVFASCVGDTADLLRKAHRYKDLYDIGVYAAKADPFASWETLVMEALSGLGKFAEAERYYDQVVDSYIHEYGNRSNDYVKEIIDKLGDYLYHETESIEEIQEKIRLTEDEGRKGYYCTLPVFQEIYRTIERTMARSADKIFLMLCTIMDSKGNPMQESPKLNELSARLKEALITSVRHTDTITRYGQGQYLALLINTTEENCQVVEKRINGHFLLKRQRTGVEFTVRSLAQGREGFPAF